MLKKTIIVLTVLLVGLLAISAVSAAENATSDIAGADDSADQVDSAIEEENFDSSNASEGDDLESYSPMAIDDEDGKLGMSNDGEILGSEIHVRGDEFALIQVAIRQANDGDIIYLEGITYTSTGSSIIISKSITLVGQEGTVLDAQGESGICVVQADNVVIKNIKFINAKYVKGSAIDIGGDSNFSLSNCTFINNTAEVGGAIYWPAADGSITNCTFIGNSADYGGAMYTGGDGGEISNCVFINNNANYGKALDARSYSKIYDSYFKNIPFLDITDEDSSLTLTLMTNLDYSGTVPSSIIKKENLKYWNGSAYVNGDDPNFGTLQCPDKNVTLELYHSNGELAYRVSNFTDANGQIVFDYSKFNDDRYVYRAYAFDDDSNFISATGRLNGNIGDFTLLQNYINNVGENGTVNLTCDYTFTDGLDDNLKEGIIIPFNLTIYGNGHTISGEKSARIFNATGSKVSIYGIKFTNGNSTGNGGAINVNGDCTLIDCIFTNNHAANNGGAVYWNTAAVGITNCTFENNTAKNGGANYFNGAVNDVTLTGNFTGNTAERAGGALYFAQKSSNNTIVAEFYNNNAKAASGGAIFFYRLAENNIFESVLRYNHASYGAGIFFYNKANNNRFSSDFRFNVAESCGGAMFFYSTTDGNNFSGYFINNSALGKLDEINGNGGAITFKNTSSNSIFTCDFVNNTAVRCGGGVNYRETPYNITFNSNFINNVAESGGGVNFFETFENVVFNGEFISNSADFGGGIAIKNGFIENISFWNNSAGNGGAIYFDDSGKVSNCEFNNNNATIGGYGDGGAIYFSNDGIVTNCNFTNNKAVYYSGAVYFGKDGFVNNSNFKGNDARDGGSVYIFGEGKVYNSNFTDNHARIGGAIEFWGNGLINNSRFNDNSAIFSGGAVYCSDDVEINGCILNNNSAIEYAGGGVCVYDGGKITHCIFTNNSAVNGGAIFWLKNRGMMSDVVFSDNSAKENGGANYFGGEVTNVNLDGNFINNTANYGGANYFGGAVTNVTLSGNFTDNFAKIDGGANYFRRKATNVTLSGNFITNSADDEGGMGGANCFNDTVTNVALLGNFTGNRAGSDGGANEFSDDVINVTLSGNFINNTAGRNGGANAFQRLTNAVFTGNYINNTGSSVIDIMNSNSGNVIRDSIFINNAPINVKKGNISAFDNWFGNNVTDYNVKPDAGIDLENWLFLNGTVSPNPVSVADTADVIFKLSRYDGENVTEYDNSRLLPINLTITSTLGSLNRNVTNLDENITYTPDSGGKGSVTALIENVFCTIEIENEKADPDMSIESDPSFASEITNITVTLPSDAKGNVTVTDAYGNNYTKPVKDGAVDIEVPNLNAGVNKLNITYSGDDEKYLSKTIEYTVQVDPMPTFLTAEVLEKYQGDDDRFAVVLTDANGNPVAGMPVKIHIVGKVYNCTTNESGVATLPINLKPGIYNVTVEFAGKGDYANATPVSSEVHVLTKIRIDKNKNLVKDYGDADKFTVRLLDEYGKPVAGEVVNMTVAGKTYHCKSNADGYASLAINLKPGTYDIVCEYAGYKVTNKITVKQVLSAYNRQYKKASSYQFTATLKHSNGKAISGKTVTFTFKGKTYTATTNSKGEATITIKEALSLGTYNIAIKYLDSTITKTITIK